MKAAVIEQQGGVENIVYRDWDDPSPGADDVIVRVKACGLNHLDIFVRRGMPGFPVPMPFISGGDIAGDICALGENVSGWSIGDRVTLNPDTHEGMIGEQLIGGLAEIVRVPAQNLVALPDSLSYEQGAAIPIAYGTAHRMLFHRGRLADRRDHAGAGGEWWCWDRLCAVWQDDWRNGHRSGRVGGRSVKSCPRSESDHTINYSEDDFSAATWKLSGQEGRRRCGQLYGRRYLGAVFTDRKAGRADSDLWLDGRAYAGN